MKAVYQDDVNRGPGNGQIILTGEMFPDQPWSISLQRSSDRQYLSEKQSGQWVGGSTYIPVSGTPRDDGSLLLDVGPGIVDSLDKLENYRIVLKGSGDSEHSARLQINQITHSPSGSVDNTGHNVQIDVQIEAPEPEPVSRPRPVPPSQPAPQPAPVGSPEPITFGPSTADNVVSEQSSSRRFLAPGIILLLICACLAWWFLDPGHKEDGAAPVAEQPQPSSQSAMQQVNDFFSSSQTPPTPEGAMRLAEKLDAKTPEDQDALYKLYYFAAGKNYAPAFLPYAECLDPLLKTWGSIEKNGADAWKYYKLAQTGEPEKSAQAITRLDDWLKQQSGQGNRKAAEWLETISR